MWEMDPLCNRALRDLFLFYHRIPIFLDFVIRQLSVVQVELAGTAKAIDVSTTEKRNIHTLLDVIETINHLIEEILEIKGFFLECFSPSFQRLVADHSSDLIASFGPSEWGISIGSFSFFPSGLDRLHESEGSVAFISLLFLGREISGIDLESLRILGTVTAISFAADGMASLGKSFVFLLSLSVDSSTAMDGLVRDIRGLAREICCQLRQLLECFEHISHKFEQSNPSSN